MKVFVLANLLAGEFLGVSVTCFHNDFVSCSCSSIVEPVGAVRDPVIDPSHEPPEWNTGIYITVRIGVGCTVARCPVFEFSLGDHIADLTVQSSAASFLEGYWSGRPSRLIFAIFRQHAAGRHWLLQAQPV